MFRYSLLILFSFLCTLSCSQKEQKKHIENSLPNFGNVDLEKIFHHKKKLAHKSQIIDTLERYYNNIWGTDMSGGILVAHADEILFEKYQGYGRENQQMPINKDTPLHIASISKPITAVAILKLIEHKKLDLNQKISTIFPDFPYKDINIFHLLSHRSGLPKYENFLEEAKYKPKGNFISNQEILDFITKNKPPLARSTDSGFMYCNTNYALLALIIEKITQKKFPEAINEMVFEPLKMKNTFIFEEKHLHTASQSFYQKGNKLFPLNELDLIYGDKNVYTTPRDLHHFSMAMFSESFLPKNLMEMAFTPYSNEKKGINNYGLGFRMKIFDNGKKLTYHTGWWHGSNTIFIHLPQSQVTIIALGNKYTRKVYSAMALSSLFEDFPYELEKIINPKADAKDILIE